MITCGFWMFWYASEKKELLILNPDATAKHKKYQLESLMKATIIFNTSDASMYC
jgi:hypothetical protein